MTKSVINLLPSYNYGDAISFAIQVKNDAGTASSQIRVTDYLPCGYTFSPANNAGWTQVGNLLHYTSNDPLSAGEVLNLTLNLTITQCSNPGNPWNNVAEISIALDSLNTGNDDFDSNPDTNPTNDPPGEDDIDNAGVQIYDLALTKSVVNPLASYQIGQGLTLEQQ